MQPPLGQIRRHRRRRANVDRIVVIVNIPIHSTKRPFNIQMLRFQRILDVLVTVVVIEMTTDGTETRYDFWKWPIAWNVAAFWIWIVWIETRQCARTRRKQSSDAAGRCG